MSKEEVKPNEGLVFMILNCSSNEIMDQAGNHLCKLIPGCVYRRQYFVKKLPVAPLMRIIMRKHPKMKCLIFGNTNKNIYTKSDYDNIVKRFKGWASVGWSYNLDYLTSRYNGHLLESELEKQGEKEAKKLMKDIKKYQN